VEAGTVAAIVVGSVAVLGCVGILIWVLICKKKRTKKETLVVDE
jgi:hypothetical protein